MPPAAAGGHAVFRQCLVCRRWCSADRGRIKVSAAPSDEKLATGRTPQGRGGQTKILVTQCGSNGTGTAHRKARASMATPQLGGVARAGSSRRPPEIGIAIPLRPASGCGLTCDRSRLLECAGESPRGEWDAASHCRAKLPVRSRPYQRTRPRAAGDDGGDGGSPLVEVSRAFDERAARSEEGLQDRDRGRRSSFLLPVPAPGKRHSPIPCRRATRSSPPASASSAICGSTWRSAWASTCRSSRSNGAKVCRCSATRRSSAADQRHEIKGVLACHNETATGRHE